MKFFGKCTCYRLRFLENENVWITYDLYKGEKGRSGCYSGLNPGSCRHKYYQ